MLLIKSGFVIVQFPGGNLFRWGDSCSGVPFPRFIARRLPVSATLFTLERRQVGGISSSIIKFFFYKRGISFTIIRPTINARNNILTIHFK